MNLGLKKSESAQLVGKIGSWTKFAREPNFWGCSGAKLARGSNFLGCSRAFGCSWVNHFLIPLSTRFMTKYPEIFAEKGEKRVKKRQNWAFFKPSHGLQVFFLLIAPTSCSHSYEFFLFCSHSLKFYRFCPSLFALIWAISLLLVGSWAKLNSTSRKLGSLRVSIFLKKSKT